LNSLEIVHCTKVTELGVEFARAQGINVDHLK